MSLGPQDKGTAFMDFINLKIKSEEYFHNFLVEFNRLRKYSEALEIHALSLIQFNSILPNILSVAVKHTLEPKRL